MYRPRHGGPRPETGPSRSHLPHNPYARRKEKGPRGPDPGPLTVLMDHDRIRVAGWERPEADAGVPARQGERPEAPAVRGGVLPAPLGLLPDERIMPTGHRSLVSWSAICMAQVNHFPEYGPRNSADQRGAQDEAAIFTTSGNRASRAASSPLRRP